MGSDYGRQDSTSGDLQACSDRAGKLLRTVLRILGRVVYAVANWFSLRYSNAVVQISIASTNGYEEQFRLPLLITRTISPQKRIDESSTRGEHS